MKRKRLVSLILAIGIIFSGLPMGDFVAYGADGDITFTRITINKIHRDLYGAEGYSILITGKNFIFENQNRVEVGIMGDDGIIKAFDPTYSTNTIIQYELEPDEISGDIYINGQPIDISEDKMPTITNKTPTTGLVDGSTDSKITLTGSGFDILKKEDPKIKGYLFQGNTNLDFETPASDKKIKSELLGGKTGDWNVKFEEKKKIEKLNDAELIISHRYIGMFSMINKLDVSEKIDLIPTQGPVGSTAFLQADELKPTDEMSVFFLKNLDDPYLAEHMGINENYRRDDKLKKDTFSFTIPRALENGSYYVVLTNNVDPNKDIKSQIKSYKVLESQFIVIDRKSSVLIDSIDPSKGSAKGVDAVIKGQNMSRLSPNIYEGGERKKVDIDTNSNKMIVEYEKGKYKVIGENGVEVKNLKREISFIVGGEVSFREGSKLDETVYDYINVRVGENFDREKLTHDVIVEIKTKVEYIEDGLSKETEIFETHTLKNGFTYEALDYQPEITSITPYRIPVGENFEAMEDLKISIVGENFSLYRYRNKDGEIQYKYPKFDFGGQFEIDPNKTDVEMKILDKQGKEIDGTEGNDLGTKILLTLPGGKFVNEDILYSSLDFKLTNPIRVPDSKDEGASTTYPIQFIKPESNKTPKITGVIPNIITTDGEKGIKITGSGFDEERYLKLFIDGEEIRGVKRNGTGTELTFDAPPRPEGIYQIIVQNEGGELATYDDFVYTRSYTNIKLNDFNPKRASANTLITVKGQNFVEPDALVPSLDGMGVYKLIGTRVLLGGKDVNEYHMDGDKIALQEYTAPGDNEIVKIEDNRLRISDYAHSIILEEKNEVGKYYTIHFNPFSGKIELSDGYKERYIIEKNKDEILATKDGADVDLIIGNKGIEIEGKTLNFKTPYKVEGGKITGNKVRVVDSGELEFTVPPMPREGYYDLTVINPDTKRDSKTGNQGFYYFFQPEFDPKIDDIKPNEGSVDGDYFINIEGSGFIDNGGENKTSVTIGSVQVPAKDVEVSIDGKNLKVRVPKYPGKLAEETDMDRKSVAVVVVNPDGGSDSRQNGFSYIIPISHPKITSLILNRGSAAGGDSVIIEGSGFRYFEPFSDLNNNTEWDKDEPYTELNDNDNWDDLRYWRSDEHKAKYDELAKDYDKLVKPILPKVYFGGKEVEVLDFTATTIEVETPKGVSGNVDVYLVNNDHGVSNKLGFQYEASNPQISSITPETGRKQGRDKVEILGSGFHQSSIKVIESPTSLKTQSLQLIQFGNPRDTNMSNEYVGIDAAQNSGRIRDRLSTVKVGDLTVRYDGTRDQKKLSFSLVEDGVEYKLDNVDYDDGQVFLPVNLLKDKDGKSYNGHEYVRIILERVTGASTTRRLRVDRGFSPRVDFKNSGQIIVETPSYYTIGSVPVSLINPDGGKATTDFQYKNPDSNPLISDIKSDGESGYEVSDGRIITEVPFTGGNTIEVIGRDFRNPVKITIGDQEVRSEIIYSEEAGSAYGKLTFEMPPMDKDLAGQDLRLVVENEDGGFAGSEPRYIHITIPETTDLEISGVSPNFGPTAGGTTVTIEGKDFRKDLDGKGELNVYFGKGENIVRVPQSDIISISFDKIVLKTPAYTAGRTDIRVKNPDGNIVVLEDGFNYVSNPRIVSVVNPENDKFVIETISVEGGEKIKLVGSDFMEGARVVFNPQLKLVEDENQARGDIITIDDKKYILEAGLEGREVERIDGQNILVETPEGKLGDKGVIVINQDGGATNIYNLVYGIPEIASPFDVRAELVFDQFIKVNWTGPSDAVEYEIYVSENGGNFEFIGTTELSSYGAQKLKPNTKYQFLIKAMGKYGTSEAIDESKSNIVETGKTVGPEDLDGKTAEKTIINKKGTNVDVVVGSEDFTAKGLVIDLNRADLVGAEDVTVRIPAKIVSTSTGKIQIKGKDYSMDFLPSAFKTDLMEENKDNQNAGIVFKVARHKENIDVKGGITIVAGRYNLEALAYVDKDFSKMDHLNGKINLVLDQDPLIIKNRRLKNMKLVRYDDQSKTWLDGNPGNRLGLYTVIGSRR